MGFANRPDNWPYSQLDDMSAASARRQLGELERRVSRFVGYGGLGLALALLVTVGFWQL